MGIREDSTDWYEVLGVPESAGQAEIRRAYLEKARQVHPDRHAGHDDDRNRSWTEVNARAAEVNKAYEVLGNEDQRREYDVRRREATAAVHESGKRPATAAEEPTSGPGKAGDVGLDGASGWAFFRDLPERTQKAILFRQQGLATDEIRVRAASTAGRWLRLGLAVAGWTFVLMTTIDTRWTAEQTIWLLAGTMVIHCLRWQTVGRGPSSVDRAAEAVGLRNAAVRRGCSAGPGTVRTHLAALRDQELRGQERSGRHRP